MNGNATIHGDLYWRSNGTLIMKGNSNVTRTKHHNAASDSILDNGVNEAKNTSMHAASLASTFPYMGLTSITSSMTINSSGALTVLNLTDLVLTNKSILTLNGSASDNFVDQREQEFFPDVTIKDRFERWPGMGRCPVQHQGHREQRDSGWSVEHIGDIDGQQTHRQYLQVRLSSMAKSSPTESNSLVAPRSFIRRLPARKVPFPGRPRYS
jgi:hypothetical protein